MGIFYIYGNLYGLGVNVIYIARPYWDFGIYGIYFCPPPLSGGWYEIGMGGEGKQCHKYKYIYIYI